MLWSRIVDIEWIKVDVYWEIPILNIYSSCWFNCSPSSMLFTLADVTPNVRTIKNFHDIHQICENQHNGFLYINCLFLYIIVLSEKKIINNFKVIWEIKHMCYCNDICLTQQCQIGVVEMSYNTPVLSPSFVNIQYFYIIKFSFYFTIHVTACYLVCCGVGIINVVTVCCNTWPVR